MNTFTHTQLVDALVKTHVHYATKKQFSDENLATIVLDGLVKALNPDASGHDVYVWPADDRITIDGQSRISEITDAIVKTLRDAGALR